MRTWLLTAALALQVLANEVEVVIDTSGSMSGREREVLGVLQSLLQKKDSNKIGITLFNNTTQRISHVPKKLTMHGGTNLTGALNEAKRHNPKSIIILTDGRPNNEKSAAAKMQELRDQKIVICSAYIGDGKAPSLLQKYSDEVFTVKDINDSLNKCLAIPKIKKLIVPAPEESTPAIPIPEDF